MLLIIFEDRIRVELATGILSALGHPMEVVRRNHEIIAALKDQL